jgi:hypothetical protein
MFRRTLPNDPSRTCLDCLSNRLTKICAEANQLKNGFHCRQLPCPFSGRTEDLPVRRARGLEGRLPDSAGPGSPTSLISLAEALARDVPDTDCGVILGIRHSQDRSH